MSSRQSPYLVVLVVTLFASLCAAAPSGEVKLSDSNAATGDQFGASVAMDGDVLVVGVPEDQVGANARQGSATVFRWNGASWVEEAELVSPTGQPVDNFGNAVSVSGDVIVVGAYRDDVGTHGNEGSARVYRWNGAVWVPEQELTSSTGLSDDWFGSSVSVDGDVIVVGAFRDDVTSNANQGSATVFRWNGATWVEEVKLTAPAGIANGLFGFSVCVDGDVIVVGTYLDDIDGNTGEGSASVFRWNGASWAHEQKLTALLGASGDNFGWSVAVAGNTIVVGAVRDNIGGDVNAGSAKVYNWNGAMWIETQELLSSNGAAFDEFGSSVSIDGDAIVVGAALDDIAGPGTGEGSATVFRFTGATWVEEEELIASDGSTLDKYGAGVCVSQGRVVIGAPLASLPGGFDQGSAYVETLLVYPWTDLGGGSPGSAGVPLLVGVGSLVGGTPAAVTLTNAPPGALLLGWISAASVPFSALGGTVYAFPFLNQLLFTASPGGTFGGAVTWPTGLPPSTNVWFQFLVQDGSVPAGITLSNGLLATTP